MNASQSVPSTQEELVLTVCFSLMATGPILLVLLSWLRQIKKPLSSFDFPPLREAVDLLILSAMSTDLQSDFTRTKATLVGLLFSFVFNILCRSSKLTFLRYRWKQHSCIFHPGCYQVSRSDPRGQAKAGQ